VNGTIGASHKPLLQVRGLTKSFGGVRAVQGLDLEVYPGELVALIGPNGAGKSTCFNMLNGQLVPDAGSVLLQGHELAGLAPRQIWRKGVGRTFQITATFGSMSVLENVQMALLSHHRKLLSWWPFAGGLYREQALALLEQVGMRPQAGRPCGILAYGDLKKVELALALAGEPGLLLMDEPTAGMHPAERGELMGLIRRTAADRNISALFTEHDMDVVFGHADRVIVMDHGQMVAQGTPEDVRENPRIREIYLGGPSGPGDTGKPGEAP